MDGYLPGEQPDDDQTIKLNTNENPWPPSPAVSEVLASVSANDLRRYPPPAANIFRDNAAALHRVERDNIIATRGGDELIRLMITTFVDPGATIAMSDPTYSLYPVLAQVQDCPVCRIPLSDDWSLPEDFAERANAQHTSLTMLVNPHAPSGRMLDIDTVSRIASALDGLLLLDEAYVDFIDPAVDYPSVSLIEHHDNVVILRSLSKGYSLAGLRFGYGIGPASLISPMIKKTSDSYNLDFVSQRIATAALGDQEHSRESWDRVRQERARLGDRLVEMGFKIPDSQANFVLATVPAEQDAESLYLSLKAEGILVRFFNQARLTNKIRITIGTPEENDQLLAALSRMI
jgi:histidinol-phosphate aminotransferase